MPIGTGAAVYSCYFYLPTVLPASTYGTYGTVGTVVARVPQYVAALCNVAGS